MTYAFMAARNIFRYKRRSFITAIAIAFGVMMTIAMDGLLIGAETDSARNIREYETGDAKIYPEGYFQDRLFLPFGNFLEPADRAAIETALRGDARGAIPFAPRTVLACELYFNEEYFAVSGSVTAQLVALDPALDSGVFRTEQTVSAGRWLRAGDEGVALGGWLAEDIGAKVGSVVSVECKGRGGFYQTFDAPVVGIVSTDDPYVNRSYVFMDLSRADELLALEGAVTEYSLRLGPPSSIDRRIAALEGELPSYAGRIYSWEKVAEDAIKITKAKSGGSKIYIFFIFVIAAVGITNTMLMAVMERKGEIGMMRALGYGSTRIRALFLLEGFGIGLMGTLFGLVLGLAVNWYMATYGVDFSFMLRDTDAGYRLTGIMRSAWHLRGIVTAVFGALAISTLVAWFPSGKILKSEVSDILRN